MKKWFLAKSLTDRIAMLLIAAIVVVGGTAAAVVAIKPAKAPAETSTTVLEDLQTALAESTDVDAKSASEDDDKAEEEGTKETVTETVVTQETETETAIEPVTFVKSGYGLVNGNFANGIGGFEFYAVSGDYADYSISNGQGIDITIDNTGDEDWHVQLKQNDVRLEEGKWYRLSLDAKSTLNRTVTCTMQRNGMLDDDWTPYCNQARFALGAGWQHYQILFKMDKNTDNNAVFNVSMGTVDGKKITKTHTVSINNISLERLPDNFTDTLRSNGNLIGNGDFSYDSILWETVVAGTGAADVSLKNNQAVFDIKNPGSEEWNVQLKQDGIKLNKWGGYRLTFNATTTVDRFIKIGLMDKNYVTWFGGGDVFLPAGTTTPVTVDFYNDICDIDDALLMISMGKIEGHATPASVVTLSDISMVKDSTVYLPQGGNGGAATAGPSIPDGWTTYDHEGTHTNAMSYSDEEGVKFSIKDTGAEEWHVQLTKKNVTVNKGFTYVISYDIMSTIDRSIKYMIQRNGGDWATYACEKLDLKANERVHVEQEFTMYKATDNDAVFNFSFGSIDGEVITTPHDIFVSNIKLEVSKTPEETGNETGETALPSFTLTKDAAPNNNNNTNWDIPLDKVADWADYVGKTVRFSCKVVSDAKFSGGITALTAVPGNDWYWNDPTGKQRFEVEPGVETTLQCVYKNFKKPMLQIWWKDDTNPADIKITDIKFEEVSDEEYELIKNEKGNETGKDESKPTEDNKPSEETGNETGETALPSFTLTKDAAPNNNNNTNWDIPLDKVADWADYVGKTVRFSCKVVSDAKFSGGITALTAVPGNDWYWNDPTGKQRFEVEPGVETTLQCVYKNFKKPMLQIWWKDDTNPADIKITDIKFEEVSDEEYELIKHEIDNEGGKEDNKPSEDDKPSGDSSADDTSNNVYVFEKGAAPKVDSDGTRWEFKPDETEYKYSELIGKKVKMTVELQSDMNFSGAIVIQSHEDYSGWEAVECKQNGNKEVQEWSVTAEDFKQAFIQIYWKENNDKADINIKSIRFEVVSDEKDIPVEPEEKDDNPAGSGDKIPDGAVLLKLGSAKNNYPDDKGVFRNWDLDLSSVNYSEYVGKKITFKATISSGKAFSGCMTQLTGNWDWNDPTDEQKFSSAGGSVTVSCTYADFKKPVIQIYDMSADVIVSDITFIEVKESAGDLDGNDPVVDDPEKGDNDKTAGKIVFENDIILAKDAAFITNEDGSHKWELVADPSKYADLIGKKVKASADVVSDSWFGGVIVVQSHEDYSGWNPSVQYDGAKVSSWETTGDDFKQLMFQFYWRDETETAADIIIKSLTIEVIE